MDKPSTIEPRAVDDSMSQPPPARPSLKKALLIAGCALFTSSCMLPLVLYFVLKDVAKLPMSEVLAVPTALFGGITLFSYFKRLWLLAKRDSTVRPIGGSRWGLDYFHWNFTLGFCYVTALITYSTATKPAQVQVAALPLTLLMLQICGQIAIAQILAVAKVKYFVRISSMPKGAYPLRPALYTIIEDVAAVDGEQGTEFRVSLNRRFEENAQFRILLEGLTMLWGWSGLVVVVVNFALIFSLKDADVSWIVGWTVPWVWALLMAFITVFWTRSTLKGEATAAKQDGEATV